MGYFRADGGKKRNKKAHYKNQQAASRKTNDLKDGLVGFLITCEATKEKRSLKECFNILNEAVE